MPVSSTTTYPRRRSRLGVGLEMQRKGMRRFLTETWQRNGDGAHIVLGTHPIVLVTHPDDIQHVLVHNRTGYDKGASYATARDFLLGDGLVTSTGDLWRRQRRLMAPFFTPRAVVAYAPVIAAEGARCVTRWDALARGEDVVDIIAEMASLTAAVAVSTLFSTTATTVIADLQGAVDTMIQFLVQRRLPLQPPLWLPTPGNRAYQQARARVHTFVSTLIAHRRTMAVDTWPDDVLSTLMRTRDQTTGAAMPDDLLRDELITLFFAGHETTARTLAFLWYALAQHPSVAARMHAELDAVVGAEPATVAQLAQLPYTLQVIKETLRLYPPTPLYFRDAVAADTLRGITIPRGAQMLFIPYLTHRHPAFWPNPEAFDPDRWEPAGEAAQHPYAYHPFAAGARVCLGTNFAFLEIHLLVAMLAQHFAPQHTPAHHPQWELIGSLVVTNGLPMTIRRR